MIFSSTVFLFLFLPLTVIIYYLCPPVLRNGVLLVSSLLFYGFGEPRYLVVMIFSILLHYGCGIAVHSLKQREKNRAAKIMLALSAAGSLSVLGYFKYAGFFMDNVNRLLGTGFYWLQPALPIGISFYTFQALSYVIDVYRGKAEVQKNPVTFAAYITLFPQLIAGPIVRYVTVEKQLKSRTVSADSAAEGIRRFITGLGKKVLLANQAGLLWEEISAIDPSQLSAAAAWLGAAAFTLQIYFDFSGYSDMAIGLGKMFGFTFEENFRYPYESKSITEFWRRWHISLGTWFREYVYIPLGGSRRGRLLQMRNLFIVWALTGLWHGASWNFLWWGLYFCVLLILEKLFLLPILEKLPRWIQHLYALFFIAAGWIIFEMTDIGGMMGYLKAMTGLGGFVDGRAGYLFGNYMVMLLIMCAGATSVPKAAASRFLRKLEGRPYLALVLKNGFYMAVLLASTAFIVGDTYQPFLYFRF